jgi:hypothetical protein
MVGEQTITQGADGLGWTGKAQRDEMLKPAQAFKSNDYLLKVPQRQGELSCF